MYNIIKTKTYYKITGHHHKVIYFCTEIHTIHLSQKRENSTWLFLLSTEKACVYYKIMVLRWCSSKKSACLCKSCESCRFDPWVEKMLWSRKWQTTPVFLPGSFYGQRCLVGYSTWGRKESNINELLSTQNGSLISCENKNLCEFILKLTSSILSVDSLRNRFQISQKDLNRAERDRFCYLM